GRGARYTFFTETDHVLLFFTQKGNCYQVPVSSLEESLRPKDRGISLAGVLGGLEAGEACVAVVDMPPGDGAGQPDLFFFTRKGMVKRTPMEEYAVRRAKVAAITLGKGDEVVTVETLRKKDDVFCLTNEGMLIRFPQEEAAVTGRVTRGVIGMKVGEGDALLTAGGIGPGDELMLASDRGYLKRIPEGMIDAQRRAGKGVHAFYFNKSGTNGRYVAAAWLMEKPGEFTVLTSGGQAVTLHSNDVEMQKLTDRGKPYVMALMDDVVTEAAW
ncbi:MAG TPA: DNA gyrase C-terminal beta-propeller domain-containing protein, partial [Candidatus Limnocylindria bacterium]|nr:DNA gyrase C-terminal beta-propeller domain-containing protein [Candidatus Limnocylindria bacterium]